MAEHIKVLFSEEEINKRILEMAKQIDAEYGDEPVHLICILKGSIFITTELAKRLSMPVTLDFMSAHSYSGTNSTGSVQVTKDLEHSIEGKNVIVIEDIIDTGKTLSFLLELLEIRNPKSLKLLTLLDKPDRRVTHVDVDYIGFTIPDEFVVGYGLDYDQKYRNLPYVGMVEFD